ncbi:Rrf2 family transcriptional regulator [Gibbsiella quercinecans]|uniref:Rrf2 family transcriptional regulator n=1 Tax=Gibbsiella quercinecans TaxID=929813 RepID=UPI00242A7420|nr:Rrf2 family transcriptional regulator [Gibbsiella quercinecans]
MKVSIESNGHVIWFRDSGTGEGLASKVYMKDGTQQKIITALEDALFQAKGQAGLVDNVD